MPTFHSSFYLKDDTPALITKPRLYLDIDGVLNVFPKRHGNPLKRPHLKAWDNWETFHVYEFVDGKDRDFTITWSPDLIAEIAKLSEVYDIHWLTQWKEVALTKFTPNTGIPLFPVRTEIGTEDYFPTAMMLAGHAKNRWWKVNAIVKDMETIPDLKWAWVDDYIRKPVRSYFKRLSEITGTESLMVTPFDAIGMTPEHLEKLYEFAKS